VYVDLQPSEKQQECKPHQRHDLHREVNAHQIQPTGTDDDTGDDLDDDSRDAQGGHEPQQQRGTERDQGHREQVHELDIGHDRHRSIGPDPTTGATADALVHKESGHVRAESRVDGTLNTCQRRLMSAGS
jgi:hypothetical protein